LSDDVKVEVRGLRELGSAFKAVDAGLPKELKGAFLGIAQRVVGVAQQKMKHVSGRSQSSVKPQASARGAAISFGGSAAPYEPWLDFGGSVGRGHVDRRGGGAIKRPIVKGGRYVYPAIAEEHEFIVHQVNEAIETVAKHAGFETRGGDA
jgi:hypothetical protein